jgi:hypothetical protein
MANNIGITSVAREDRGIKKESLTRKLTDVAGRMSSSKARRAQVIPHSMVWCVGDSPRGPLKQLGNPHLKPATKPNTPRLTVQDTAHAAEAPNGPPRWPTRRSPRAGFASLEGVRPPRAGSTPFEGVRLPRAGSASLEGPLRPRTGPALLEGAPHARACSRTRAFNALTNGGAAPSCAWGSRPGAAAPTPQEGAHPRHCGEDCAAWPVPVP